MACFLTLGCAPKAPPQVPEATPLPTAQAARESVPAPTETSVVNAPPSEPVAPSATYRVEHSAEGVVVLARDGQPCPWVEYARTWNSLRFRSDRGECAGKVSLGNASKEAIDLILALQKELGPAFAPASFGMNDYPEMYERIARTAAGSPLWDKAQGKPKKGSPNEAVVAMAADAKTFYPEVVALFEPLKLTPRFSSVEKVLVGKVESTPFADGLLAAGVAKGDQVPYGSIVWFHLDAP